MTELSSSKDELLKNLQLVQEKHNVQLSALNENLSTLRTDFAAQTKRLGDLQLATDEAEAHKLGGWRERARREGDNICNTCGRYV